MIKLETSEEFCKGFAKYVIDQKEWNHAAVCYGYKRGSGAAARSILDLVIPVLESMSKKGCNTYRSHGCGADITALALLGELKKLQEGQ